MTQGIKTIAVDLTPVLPKGENGGAKIFVLELLQSLSEMLPHIQFVLLTHAASHNELKKMERINVRCLMVGGATSTNLCRRWAESIAKLMAPSFIIRLRNIVSHLSDISNADLNRCGSKSILRKIGADLLFCPFSEPYYFEPGIPTVCTIYDLQYKTYPEFFSSDDVANRERTFISACKRATKLAAISDYARSSAITHGGLNPEHISTIHLRLAQRVQTRVSHSTGILKKHRLRTKRYLLYPANFWKHKNHEMLLTAFGIACQDGLPKDIRLVCTGAPGERRDWLCKASRAMHLSERVCFPGYLSNDDFSELLRCSGGMIFPSLYEGFGMPVVEAMVANVPVACSKIASLPEVSGDAAIYFDPRVPTQISQAMISLINDKNLCAKLIQAGRVRADEFSDKARMAQEYWDLFQHAFAHKTHENQLVGNFADGWIGNSLSIQVAPSGSAQSLKIEFSAPAWLPHNSFTVQTLQGGVSNSVPITFNRGTNKLLVHSVSSEGGCYELIVRPTFVPARYGYGEDRRELSVMLQRCVLEGSAGQCTELFSRKESI